MKKNKPGKNEKIVRHNVFAECSRAMRSPMLLNALNQVVAGLLLVLTADVLGRFADAAFALKLEQGLANAVILAGCVLATVLAVPGLGLLSDFLMLEKALQHDNLVFGRYLDKDPEKAAQLNAGEMQYQLEDAPNNLRIKWVELIGKAMALPVGLGYLLYSAGRISWLLTGLMFLLAAVRLIVPLMLRKRLAGYDALAKEYQAKRRSCETDVTARPCVLRLWGIEKPILKRIDRLYADYHAKTESRYITCQSLSQHMQEFSNSFTQLLLFLAGAVMVAKGGVTPGEFAAVLVYLSVTQTLLNYIGEIIQDYSLMMNAADRVSIFYQDAEDTTGKPIDNFTGLTGRDISLSFGENKVLSDVNFCVAAGEKVCLVGENGCGKSTLGRIINVTVKSYSGVLAVGDLDLKTVCVEDWRRLIAYAPQTPFLFQTTVRENIAMGSPEAGQGEVDRVMEAFGILPLADRMVSAESKLSGGERQKISVARALLKKAPLLILDEPTNHLDYDSIRTLKQHIATTSQTVILISHDPALQQVSSRLIRL